MMKILFKSTLKRVLFWTIALSTLGMASVNGQELDEKNPSYQNQQIRSDNDERQTTLQQNSNFYGENDSPLTEQRYSDSDWRQEDSRQTAARYADPIYPHSNFQDQQNVYLRQEDWKQEQVYGQESYQQNPLNFSNGPACSSQAIGSYEQNHYAVQPYAPSFSQGEGGFQQGSFHQEESDFQQGGFHPREGGFQQGSFHHGEDNFQQGNIEYVNRPFNYGAQEYSYPNDACCQVKQPCCSNKGILIGGAVLIGGAAIAIASSRDHHHHRKFDTTNEFDCITTSDGFITATTTGTTTTTTGTTTTTTETTTTTTETTTTTTGATGTAEFITGPQTLIFTFTSFPGPTDGENAISGLWRGIVVAPNGEQESTDLFIIGSVPQNPQEIQFTTPVYGTYTIILALESNLAIPFTLGSVVVENNAAGNGNNDQTFFVNEKDLSVEGDQATFNYVYSPILVNP
jgi:hypothetical protein